MRVVIGFRAVDWECPNCWFENIADEFGPVRCQYCQRDFMAVTREQAAVLAAPEVDCLGQWNEAPEEN